MNTDRAGSPWTMFMDRGLRRDDDLARPCYPFRRDRGNDMTRAKRTILAMMVLELFLAGLWYYLAGAPGAGPDTARVLGQTMGTAMGVVLGLSPLLYLLARSNDRKAAAKKDK
jgi:hypothetical protein